MRLIYEAIKEGISTAWDIIAGQDLWFSMEKNQILTWIEKLNSYILHLSDYQIQSNLTCLWKDSFRHNNNPKINLLQGMNNKLIAILHRIP